MAKEKSVIVFCDYLEQFEDLSDEDFGAVLRAVLRYNLGEGEPTFDDPMLNVVFKVIKRSVDKANDHYEEVCRNRGAARKEGAKKAKARGEQKDRTESKESKESKETKETKESKAPEKDKEKDKDKDKEKDKDREKDKDKEKDKDRDREKEKGKEKAGAKPKAGDRAGRGGKYTPEPPKHLHGRYQNVALSEDEYDAIREEFPLDYDERIEKLSEYMSSTGKRYRNYLATLRSWRRREEESGGKRSGPRYRPEGAEAEIFSDDIYEVF